MASNANKIKDMQKLVYDTARAAGLEDLQAKIVVSQAIHESGNFSSNVFKTANNAFGMKYPSRRPRKYIKGKSNIVMRSEGATPYAEYTSPEQSVKDLILGWHAYNKTKWENITSPAQYANYLKSKGYYGDDVSNYVRSTEKIIKGLEWLKTSIVSNPGSYAGIFIIGISIFILLNLKK